MKAWLSLATMCLRHSVLRTAMALSLWVSSALPGAGAETDRGITVAIAGDEFQINGKPTYGSLRSDYLGRLERIIDKADELRMVVILGYFYFGQDQRLKDEGAVTRAADNATKWVFDHGYRNVLIEINNECNVAYDHDILRPDRVHELIQRVQNSTRGGRRLLVSTSYGGGFIPQENVVRVADFLLVHGNGVSDPDRIADMIRKTRQVAGYHGQPIVFNEDDHFDFDKPNNNFVAAISEHASWGYFDYRKNGEEWDAGYQSVPVNWGISSARKRGFFELLSEITGANLSQSSPKGTL